jgi:hypothetical protein
MTQYNQQDPINAYKEWAHFGKRSWIADAMPNYIPRSIHHACQLASQNFSQQIQNAGFYSAEHREKLGKIFERITKRYHVFSDKARDHLEVFYQNGLGVEVAHQPKFLGGERFIYNKLACGTSFSSSSGFFPFFYLGDYDKVHPELIKTHFSLSNSSSGFSLSIPPAQEKTYTDACIEDLPLPTTDEIAAYLDKIRKQYQFSIKASVTDKWQQKLYEERLDSTLLLLKTSWSLSYDYSDWFLNMIGYLSNIVGDQGYLLFQASDPEFRRLSIPHYEYLLKNREKYISAYNSLRKNFVQQGYTPPLREIQPSLVPFFYECQTPQCFHQRIQLHTEPSSSTQSKVLMKGICSKCKTPITLEVDPNHPDFSEFGYHLTPRVETRQFLTSSLIPIGIHVAGTGEARYYTMAIPLIKKFAPHVPLPVIYFYNKSTMNTAITRSLEQQLIDLPLPGFLDNLKGLMKNVGKFNKLCKKSPNEAEFANRRQKAIELLTQQHSYLDVIEKLCSQFLRDNPDSPATNLVASYKSNLFGTISKEKHGQEAVFHWVDLALKNGISHLFEDYTRYYKSWLPPGLDLMF